jgi:HEAT repeat protein
MGRVMTEYEQATEALQKGDPYARRHAIGRLKKFGDPRAVTPLCRALQDSNSEVRLGAAEALGVVGDQRSVEPLCKALRDEDARVRSAAAVALGKHPDERAVLPLCETLQDGDAQVRRSGSSALGMAGDERSVGLLVAALRDWDTGVREHAAAALGKLGRREALQPLQSLLIESLLLGGFLSASYRGVFIAARDAIKQIKRSTDHPIPSSAPVADVTTLPRPANPKSPDASSLPVVVEGDVKP